jgi:hypothetical protein
MAAPASALTADGFGVAMSGVPRERRKRPCAASIVCRQALAVNKKSLTARRFAGGRAGVAQSQCVLWPAT